MLVRLSAGWSRSQHAYSMLACLMLDVPRLMNISYSPENHKVSKELADGACCTGTTKGHE